jgi:hypothetical protein
MTKQAFLDKLRSRLSILDDNEVEDILSEYAAHIDQKVASGKTEEQAIADFGDFNELVKAILSAYKIKDNASSSDSGSQFKTWLHSAIDEITDFMKPLIDRVGTLQGDQVGYFIAYLFLTLITVWLVQIPFWLIDGLGNLILRIIPFVGGALGAILSIFIKLAQVVVSIVILIYGVQRAIEAATQKKAVDFGIVINDKPIVEAKFNDQPKTTVKVNTEPKTTVNVTVEPKAQTVEAPKPVEPLKAVETPIPPVEPIEPVSAKKPVILPAIGSFFVLLFKAFVVVCMIPGVMIALGLFVVLGILIALLVKGIAFFGLFLIIIGLLIATTTVLDMIRTTVFGKKVRHA